MAEKNPIKESYTIRSLLYSSLDEYDRRTLAGLTLVELGYCYKKEGRKTGRKLLIAEARRRGVKIQDL